MGKLHLYVAETDHPQGAKAEIVIKDEITQEELTQLNTAFRVCSLYHSITQIKDIVVENGESFKRFMSPQNLQEIRNRNIPPERAITLANKAVLNYASSIKTYIDMEKRLLTKRATESDLNCLKICNTLFTTKIWNIGFGRILETILFIVNFHIPFIKNPLKTAAKSSVLKNTCFSLITGNIQRQIYNKWESKLIYLHLSII